MHDDRLEKKRALYTQTLIVMNTLEKGSHPGGPSSRCPACKMPTHFCSSLLSNRTYSNAAPGSFMFLVKRRALDWISLLRYTPPENTNISSYFVFLGGFFKDRFDTFG